MLWSNGGPMFASSDWGSLMVVYTDCVEYAERCLRQSLRWETFSTSDLEGPVRVLATRVFSRPHLYRSRIDVPGQWRHLFLVEFAPRSHVDLLCDLRNENLELPDPILCCAGAGSGFHGFKQRAWAGIPGNIHLVTYQRPKRQLNHPGAGVIVVAVVSILETLDSIPALKGRASVKWVNDILIEGAKVGGVLARTQSIGQEIDSIILGIGLNVASTPEIERDRFVPRAGSLWEFVPDPGACSVGQVLTRLIESLERNYHRYLAGEFEALLNFYRARSSVAGRKVSLFEDPAGKEPSSLYGGRVLSIGEDLELYLEGRDEPVLHGRLVVDH